MELFFRAATAVVCFLIDGASDSYLLHSLTTWLFADNGFIVLHWVCLRFLPQLEEESFVIRDWISTWVWINGISGCGKRFQNYDDAVVKAIKLTLSFSPVVFFFSSDVPVSGLCLLSSHPDTWDAHKLKNAGLIFSLGRLHHFSRSCSKDSSLLFPFSPIFSLMLRWFIVDRYFTNLQKKLTFVLCMDIKILKLTSNGPQMVQNGSVPCRLWDSVMLRDSVYDFRNMSVVHSLWEMSFTLNKIN